MRLPATALRPDARHICHGIRATEPLHVHRQAARFATRSALAVLHGKVEYRHEVEELLVEQSLLIGRELPELSEHDLHVSLPMREKPHDRLFDLALRQVL